MICPTCELCEYAQYCGATEIMRKCERHNKKEPLNNEEWFCGLSTEEKAEVLCNVVPELAYENDGVWDEKKFVEWLKGKHQ